MNGLRVQLVPHRKEWAGMARHELGRLQRLLGEHALRAEHIGSTAIPGIHAKPIIDLLLEVDSLDELDQRSASLQALGYECMGEFGIPDRRYFRRNDGGRRSHQLHAFERGSAHILRHIAFRDYLIAHPRAAGAYDEIKRRLANLYPADIEAYMDGKDPFIKQVEAQALAWWSTGWKAGGHPSPGDESRA